MGAVHTVLYAIGVEENQSYIVLLIKFDKKFAAGLVHYEEINSLV